MSLHRRSYSLATGALILLVVGLQPRLVLAEIPAGDASSEYRIKRLFFGCWQVKWPQPKSARWPSQTTWCFHSGRAIGGVTFDAGDGWEFCKRWRVNGQKLMVRDNYGNAQDCSFAFSGDRQTLILRNCPAAGNWKRNDVISKVDKQSGNCRTQESIFSEDSTDVAP